MPIVIKQGYDRALAATAGTALGRGGRIRHGNLAARFRVSGQPVSQTPDLLKC